MFFVGVLLYGPPGTGKTLLARACAAQTKVIPSFELIDIFLTSCFYFFKEELFSKHSSCLFVCLVHIFEAGRTSARAGMKKKPIFFTMIVLCDGPCHFTVVKSNLLFPLQMFIGDGAKLVRDAFALAKEKAPAIIFIDELDAIGTKVGSQEFFMLYFCLISNIFCF